jgi:hypothetical protein
VRVLRIHCGPGEKSVMHSHPASAASAKAGEVQWEPAGPHLPENVGAKAFDLTLVELKSTPAA